jgi:hypothetical protein
LLDLLVICDSGTSVLHVMVMECYIKQFSQKNGVSVLGANALRQLLYFTTKLSQKQMNDCKIEEPDFGLVGTCIGGSFEKTAELKVKKIQ